jgi:hypothetical protein
MPGDDPLDGEGKVQFLGPKDIEPIVLASPFEPAFASHHPPGVIRDNSSLGKR